MNTTYHFTYDDVMKKASAYVLLDSMSEADRQLTMKNPDAGMTVLQSRYDYKNAATDDARALSHLRAERTRQQYGGYSGGVDGSKFYLNDLSPMDYADSGAPSFRDDYGEKQKALLDKTMDREKYSSAYGDTEKNLLAQLEKEASSGNDAQRDDLFASYAKQYRREGERAVADTMGTAAALTGGIPSTAAVTAANQAGQYYATKLSDKLPELEAAAANQKAARQQLLLNALQAASSADDRNYQRYLDEIGLDYDQMDLLRALRNDDYVQYRDALSQYNTDRDFGYRQFTDDLQYQDYRSDTGRAQKNYENELEMEKQQYNDDRSRLDEENLWNAAVYALEYLNDSSLLKRLIAKAKGE